MIERSHSLTGKTGRPFLRFGGALMSGASGGSVGRLTLRVSPSSTVRAASPSVVRRFIYGLGRS